SDGLTKTGRVLGTTDYVSPEQAMGHGVDARSDIYSLGVLLYEMLTGEVPFQAETVVGVAMKHVNEEMPDVRRLRPEISIALAAVVAALLIVALTGNHHKQVQSAATAHASGAPIPLVHAMSFDPTSDGGDGSEHPELTQDAIDGNPGTAWHTDAYQTSPI